VAPLQLAHTTATQVIETNNFKKMFVSASKRLRPLRSIQEKKGLCIRQYEKAIGVHRKTELLFVTQILFVAGSLNLARLALPLNPSRKSNCD